MKVKPIPKDRSQKPITNLTKHNAPSTPLPLPSVNKLAS